MSESEDMTISKEQCELMVHICEKDKLSQQHAETTANRTTRHDLSQDEDLPFDCTALERPMKEAMKLIKLDSNTVQIKVVYTAAHVELWSLESADLLADHFLLPLKLACDLDNAQHRTTLSSIGFIAAFKRTDPNLSPANDWLKNPPKGPSHDRHPRFWLMRKMMHSQESTHESRKHFFSETFVKVRI